MFFSFLAVFPLPESYQNDPKFHFNTLLRSDTQKSSKNVENTTVFWSRCETVFAPPAKADIATAISMNVIEHLVLLFCPPISTPSPPKRCGRILTHVSSWCFANASAFRSPMMSINWRLRALPPSGPFEPYIIPTARCFLCWTYAGDPANVLNSLKPKNSSLASPNTFRMCSFWQTRRPPNGITARI